MNALAVRSAQARQWLRAAALPLLLGALPVFTAPQVGAAEPAADAAGDWRVTLLKPPDCVACVWLEESLKRHGTLQRATLSDGQAQVTARIERRQDGDVTAAEWQEMLRLPAFDAAVWRQQHAEHAAQLLLKHDGHVVAAGNISESVELRDARFPADLTLPLGDADVERVRAGYQDYYRELFIGSWNLDWFFRVARDPSVADSRRFAHWVERQPVAGAPQLGTANVLLASTANGASDNPIFNALRSEEIERTLTQQLGVDAARIQVRYGAGTGRGFDAVEQTRTGLRFVRRDVPRAEPLTLRSLSDFFTALRAQPPAHNLIVLVGHGGPDGAPLWGEVAPLGPEEMQTLHQRGRGDDVLVSGNCYGGVLARTVSCGYFGARPDTVATGCQANAAEVAQSQDYLHVYFEAFRPERRALADADGDGVVSFEEAHWYATRFGDERNITYSTLDALADAWLATHADALPEDISLAEMRQLAEAAGAAEREALQTMTGGLSGSHRFALGDLAAQAERYAANPSGPRPMLGQLARRLLYLARGAAGDPAVAAVRACGARSPAAFLQP